MLRPNLRVTYIYSNHPYWCSQPCEPIANRWLSLPAGRLLISCALPLTVRMWLSTELSKPLAHSSFPANIKIAEDVLILFNFSEVSLTLRSVILQPEMTHCWLCKDQCPERKHKFTPCHPLSSAWFCRSELSRVCRLREHNPQMSAGRLRYQKYSSG